MADLLSIWQHGKMNEEAIRTVKLIGERQDGIEHCSIHLLTPLRIRRNGKMLCDVDFPTLIRNITARVTALTARYGGTVNAEEVEQICELANQVTRTSAGLFLSKVERYSSKRNSKMDLSGLLGALTFEGDLSVFVPWLNAARILHIGRNVTFGCGRIDVIFG